MLSTLNYKTFFMALLVLWSFLPLSAHSGMVKLVATTSTENSGLLAFLIEKFWRIKSNRSIDVHVIAFGTGQAIRTAMNGDADMLIVHDKASELEFMAAGFGLSRDRLMYNEFILVGPKQGHADIFKITDVNLAFNRLWCKGIIFVSRGDKSGTHLAELRLWRQASLNTPDARYQNWYRSVGAGMGAALNIAASINAYTLTDRGTWISFNNRQDLVEQVSGVGVLNNQYSVILINPKKHPHVNLTEASKLRHWLLSDLGQSAIKSFRLKKQILFYPNYQKRL